MVGVITCAVCTRRIVCEPKQEYFVYHERISSKEQDQNLW